MGGRVTAFPLLRAGDVCYGIEDDAPWLVLEVRVTLGGLMYRLVRVPDGHAPTDIAMTWWPAASSSAVSASA